MSWLPPFWQWFTLYNISIFNWKLSKEILTWIFNFTVKNVLFTKTLNRSIHGSEETIAVFYKSSKAKLCNKALKKTNNRVYCLSLWDYAKLTKYFKTPNTHTQINLCIRTTHIAASKFKFLSKVRVVSKFVYSLV